MTQLLFESNQVGFFEIWMGSTYRLTVYGNNDSSKNHSILNRLMIQLRIVYKYGLAELCHRLFSLKIGSIVLLERQKILVYKKKLDLPNFGNFEKDLKCSIGESGVKRTTEETACNISLLSAFI